MKLAEWAKRRAAQVTLPPLSRAIEEPVAAVAAPLRTFQSVAVAADPVQTTRPCPRLQAPPPARPTTPTPQSRRPAPVMLIRYRALRPLP